MHVFVFFFYYSFCWARTKMFFLLHACSLNLFHFIFIFYFLFLSKLSVCVFYYLFIYIYLFLLIYLFSLVRYCHFGDSVYVWYYMSRVVRNRLFAYAKNKDADQLCGNREADQRLCFHYTNSTIPLLSKSKISSSTSRFVCGTWSNPKTGFLRTRLI